MAFAAASSWLTFAGVDGVVAARSKSVSPVDALTTEAARVPRSGSAAAEAMLHVRRCVPAGTALGCGRGGGALSVGSGTASTWPEPEAIPAKTEPVARSRKTTPSAENSHAVGCFAMTARMPPAGAAFGFAAPSRAARRLNTSVGWSCESVTRQ